MTAAIDRAHHWLQLASGRRFTFEGPVAPIAISDVADALAKLCRFGGATCDFYSVAQHSVLVSDLAMDWARANGYAANLVRDAGLAALLHDAHEMVLADICRPTKWWLAERVPGFGAALAEAEQVIDARLAEALGIRCSAELFAACRPLTKWADNMALAIERRDLMTATDDVWHGIPTRSEIVHHPELEALPWHAAAADFVLRWATLVSPRAA